MPCYHLIQAFQSSTGQVFFQERGGQDIVRTLQLPCGRCQGCRLERSRQWAVRCLNEAQMHDGANSYVTLTYDDLPFPSSLDYRDFQLFMKRLRKVRPGVRFFMCGEYGELLGRPHFHACLFGCFFSDRVYHATSDSGARLYRSAELERLWPHGFSSVGDVTFESAAYVARYVMKKITGEQAEAHYGGLTPEFCHMSLKPGIGSTWLDKYLSDVYPTGMMVVNGRQVRPPKFYDRRFKKLDASAFEELSAERDAQCRANAADNTDERLAVKEQVVAARTKLLKRTII